MRAVAFSLLTFLAGGLGAPTLEPPPPPPVRSAQLSERIPRLFVDAVNKVIRGTIRPTRIRYSPPASLFLEDAVLLDPSGRQVARVERAEATIAVTPLLAGNLVIKELVLERPVLELEVDKDGALNLIEALSAKDKSKGDKEDPPDVEIRLDDIRVSGARFSFKNPEGVRVGARGISGKARVDVDLKQRSVVMVARELVAEAGRVDLDTLGVPLSGVRVDRVRVVNDRLELSGGRGKASGADVRAGGTLSWAKDGRLNFTGRVEGPKGLWPERLEAPPFALPAFAADVAVTGSFTRPRVTAKGSFKSFSAYDYSVDSGTAEVVVTTESAQIVAATLHTGGATATARGTVLFTPRTLDLEGRVEALPLKVALAPAKLTDPPRGSVTGGYRMKGSFALDKGPLVVSSSLSVRNLAYADVSSPSPLTLESRVALSDRAARVESAHLSGKGLSGDVRGAVLLKEERVELTVDVSAESPERWLKDLPPRLTAKSAAFRGTVAGPYANVVVKGAVEVPSADVYGVPLKAAKTTLTADKARVRLDDLRARAADGEVKGHVVVRLAKAAAGGSRAKRRPASPALEGEILVDGADLARMKLAEEGELDARGSLSLRASLGGTVARPIITIGARAKDAVLQSEALGDVEARLLVTRDLLRVQKLTLEGALGALRSEGALTLRFDDQALGGTVLVELADLSRIQAAKDAGLAGQAAGRVRLGGTVERPDLMAWLDVTSLALRDAPLGDGPVFVRVTTAKRAATKAKRAFTRVVEASGRLVGPRGLVRARAAYDLDDELVNAQMTLVEMDLLPWLQMAPEDVPRAAGLLSGKLHVWGPIAAVNGTLRLSVPELVFLEEEPGQEGAEPAPPVGTEAPSALVAEMRRVQADSGLALSAELIDGQLDALLCAFPGGATEETVGPCGGGERVWLRASGRVSQATETFAVELRGYVDEDRLEHFVPRLRELEAQVSLVATGRADVVRAKRGEDVSVSGDLVLLATRIDLVDTPTGVLEEPARLRFDKNKVFFKEPVRFKVGDSRVTVAGHAGPSDVKLDVDGTVLLALAKLYSAEVTQASGTADAKLEIIIDDELPRISGSVTANPGASITLRSWRDRVDLLSGRIAFQPISTEEANTAAERILIDELKVSVGEGQASLDGSFVVLLQVKEEGGLGIKKLSDFDLLATGESIRIRQDRSRLEAAFNLRLEQRGQQPLLSGQLEVADGFYRERFELLNDFVLARPKRPSEPLYQQLAPYGLADLALNIDVAVRDFRVRADIDTFPMDASLMGNLRLSNTVRVPALGGALEVIEGSLVLPTARFEIADSTIEFPRERMSLEPRVNLFARAELPPSRTGCEAELPVTLSLEGETTEELQLDLEADNGERHTRLDLFMNVLFGQRLALCEAARGLGDPSRAALRAFTGNLASGFTREIESAIADRFGGDIQVSVFLDTGKLGTDVRWQLGRRVVFEGEAPLYTWETGAGSSLASREGVNTSNLRLRFLWFDHLPPGDGELFLETELSAEENDLAGTTESNLEGRLKYRLFEY